MSTTANIRNRCECHDCTQARAKYPAWVDYYGISGAADIEKAWEAVEQAAQHPKAHGAPRAYTMGCKLAGPGRGDCEHFTGIPKSWDYSGKVRNPSSDEYGIPAGWCDYCWMAHRFYRVPTDPIRTTAVTAERERCAKIAISFMISSEFARNQLLGNVAAAIREGK